MLKVGNPGKLKKHTMVKGLKKKKILRMHSRLADDVPTFLRVNPMF